MFLFGLNTAPERNALQFRDNALQQIVFSVDYGYEEARKNRFGRAEKEDLHEPVLRYLSNETKFICKVDDIRSLRKLAPDSDKKLEPFCIEYQEGSAMSKWVYNAPAVNKDADEEKDVFKEVQRVLSNIKGIGLVIQ